jgi:hypothetical protein
MAVRLMASVNLVRGRQTDMTENELNRILNGQELLQTIDVRTLVLDMVRNMNQEEWMALFWDKLDLVSEEQLKEYFYMRRG